MKDYRVYLAQIFERIVIIPQQWERQIAREDDP